MRLLIIMLLMFSNSLLAQVATTPTKVTRDSSTTYTYKIKTTNEVVKVYKGKNGGLYIWRKSAKGNMYKQYIKI